jgi:hypothetical protein
MLYVRSSLNAICPEILALPQHTQTLEDVIALIKNHHQQPIPRKLFIG